MRLREICVFKLVLYISFNILIIMEAFLPSEIARLILGYLEEEKCQETCASFLQSSEHLKECYEFSKRGRKFSTKVMGKTLSDILEEYCKISSIVQDHLKKLGRSDDSDTPMLNLPEQIKCLFESTESTSPTQTMLFRVTLPGSSSRANRVPSKIVKNDRGKRAIAHVEVDNGNEVSDDNGNEWSGEDNVDNGTDALDVEATPLESLPGNERPSSRRKSVSNHLEKSIDCPEKLDLVDLDLVIQKAFLDNTELHEKIAQNINKVINTPEIATVHNEPHQTDHIDILNTGPGIDKELNSIIKTIVQETENDPAFEKLINGIVVENQEFVSEDSDSRVYSWSESSTPQRPSSIPRDQFQRRRIQNAGRSLPDIRKGQKRTEIMKTPRSRNLKRTSIDLRKQFDTMSKIEDQNAEAIQSIIEVTHNDDHFDRNITHSNVNVDDNPPVQNSRHRTESRKMISMDGTIENVSVHTSFSNSGERNSITVVSPSKCILTSSANAPICSVADYIVVTSNPHTNLALAPSTNSSNLPSTSSAPPYQQSTYILGQENVSTSSANVAQNIIVVQSQYPPASNVSSGPSFTINTSQDIMQMPIVMYTDSVDASPNVSASVSHHRQVVSVNNSLKKKYRPILPNYPPQSIITVQPFYEPLVTEQLPIIVEPVQPPTISIPTNATMVQTVPPSKGKILAKTSETGKSTSKTPPPAIVKPLQKENSTVQEVENQAKSNCGEGLPPIETPTEAIKNTRLTTPKSDRSHIRALDFSTPEKSNTQRKALTSPKVKGLGSKSNAKEARVSLFKCDTILEPIPDSASLFRRDDEEESPPVAKNIGIATRTPNLMKPTEDWDQVNLMFQPNKRKSGETAKRNRSYSESDASPDKIEQTKNESTGPISWDTDIRSLVTTNDINLSKKSVTHRKRGRKRARFNTSKSPKSLAAPTRKRRSRILKQTPPVSENKRVTRSSTKDKTNSPSLPTQTRKRSVKKKIDKTPISETTPNSLPMVVESTSTVNDFWINKNQPTKYKQKCNPTEVVLDEVVEPIVVETIESTIIIASKVASTTTTTSTDNLLIKPPQVENKTGEQASLPMITLGRNIHPYLETPVKEDFLGIPITPRLMTPTSIAETPITKLLNEQTETIDAALMPTPGGLSLTPLLAVTPKFHDYSSPVSYQSRPTDYSSCSSFYAPSEPDVPILNNALQDKNRQEHQLTPPVKEVEKTNAVAIVQTDSNKVDESVTDAAPVGNQEETSSSSEVSSSNASSSESSTYTSNSSSSDDNTVIHNASISKSEAKVEEDKATDTIEPPKEKIGVESQVRSVNTQSKYDNLSAELNEKRLRTINKFKQEASAKSNPNQLKKTNVGVKKIPQRKPKAVKPVITPKKPKTTLASLLKTRRSRSKSKLESPRQKAIKSHLDISNDKDDFPSLHISTDDEKGEASSTATKSSPVQESDTESAIALVTHLKERGILLMPNKKNKNSDKKTKKSEEANKVTNSVVESKLLTDEKANNEPVEKCIDDSMEIEHQSEEQQESEDCEKDFSNVCLDKEIMFDSKKTTPSKSNDNDSTTDLNSSFSKYEIDIPPKQVVPRKRIIRRVSTCKLNPSKNIINNAAKLQDLNIRTSSPIVSDSRRDVMKDVEMLSKCSPIAKEKPIKLKISKKSNDCNDYKSVAVGNYDVDAKKSNSNKKEPFRVLSKDAKIGDKDSTCPVDQVDDRKQKDDSSKKDADRKEISSGNCTKSMDNKDRKKSVKKVKDDVEEGECSNSDDDNLKSNSSEEKKSKISRPIESIAVKKRKISPDRATAKSAATISKSNKKIKQNHHPENLLLNLDVDKFLTKVHGPNK